MENEEYVQTEYAEDAPVAKTNVYTKLNKFRADAIQLDWSDDKMMSGQKVAYKYLSTDKIKKQLAPLLVKNGLELRLQFEDLQFLTPVNPLEKQCVVTLNATFIDIDTGEESTCKVYGEGGDFLDKAVSKAQTFALKEWLTSYLLLADGIDADALDAKFQPKTSSETEVVRSKVLENAVKPPAPKATVPKVVETPKPKVEEVPKTAPEAPKVPEAKPETKPETPEAKPEVPKTPAPKPKAPKTPKATPGGVDAVEEGPKPAESDIGIAKGEAPIGDSKSEAGDVPSEAESKPVANKYTPSGIQKKVIDKIIEDWTQLATSHKVSVEEYNEMSYDRATLSCAEDARNFIAKYKGGPSQ